MQDQSPSQLTQGLGVVSSYGVQELGGLLIR